ncbi:MAG TPA: acyl-CoA dehydrogenase C-terminal domain-containing protein, partial [Caulobacteraceae bacterium]
GEHAVALLMSVGDLLIGYLLLRQALAAQAALDAGASTKDADFYAGKLAVARWFTRNMLPELTARRAIIEHADLSLMQVAEAAF